MEHKFVLHWKIKNFRYNILKNGEYISSPSFSLTHFLDTKWCLDLYPNGWKENQENFISCFLHKLHDEGKDIKIKCIFKTKFGQCISSFEKNMKNCTFWGFSTLIPCGIEVLQSDSFVIVCELLFNSLSFLDSVYHDRLILPFVDTSDSQFIGAAAEHLKAQVSTENFKTKQKLFAFPTKCYAQTEFCFEKRILEWPVDISLLNDSKRKQIIPAMFPSMSFLISLCKNEDFDSNVEAEICIIKENYEEDITVTCLLTVLVDKTEFIRLTEEKHVFNKKSVKEVWKLEGQVSTTLLNSKMDNRTSSSLSWRFEFSFSNGKEHTNILWEESANVYDETALVNTDFLSLQMETLYNQNKHCDTILRVQEKNFRVHKAVLSAMSPVFSTMLDSGMKESVTSTIEIVDFDEDEISELISFLYSGKVKNLNVENVPKLYALADKYEISTLMSRCRNILIENTTAKNVCEFLALSDAHNDLGLKEHCTKIIRFYENDVFELEEWKQFEENNPKLAINILRNI